MMRRFAVCLPTVLFFVIIGFIAVGCGATNDASSSANAANTRVAVVATPDADTPTPVPTFTPTSEPTMKPTDTPTLLPTNTPVPTDTPVAPTATKPAPPPAATATRRPATATPVPPPALPTETPKPSVDFKVIEARLLSAVENGGTSVNGSLQTCGNGQTFFIKVIDKNSAPLDGILVQRYFASNVQPPPTGFKGPGKTEDVAGGGNQFRVVRDTSGRIYSSEWTRSMSTIDKDIPNSDLIASGYCHDDAECNYRKENNQLCLKHYSYSVIFQRQ